jgi:hypothetical protein
MQVPVQALSQQTWSGEQLPESHSPAAAQPAPSAFFVLQVPLLLQYCVLGQSAVPVQGLAQPVTAHANTPQSIAIPAVQVPAPSQVPAGTKVCASEQLACPQGWPLSTLRHWPLPSQVPSWPQALVAVWSWHMARGLVPVLAFAQVPSFIPVYVAAQALQAPAQSS